MKRFLALLHARNLEFLRDRAALVWALLFPTLMIIGCALIFSGNRQNVLSIGVTGDRTQAQALLAGLPEGTVAWHDYPEHALALQRVRFHQLDMLIDTGTHQYWTNPLSSRGAIAAALLQQQVPAGWSGLSVEGRAIRYVDWALPGILGMNMMFASLFGVGYVVVRYRMNGVLKRLQATPASAFEFLAAQVTSRLLLILLASIVIFIGCNQVLGFLMLGHYGTLLLTAVLGGLSMISLGLLISSRTDSEEFAGGMLNLCTWPMMFLSGVWFPLDDAPRWLQDVANTLPLTHLVSAARSIMLDGATLTDVQGHLLALAITTAVLIALASALFRWHRE